MTALHPTAARVPGPIRLVINSVLGWSWADAAAGLVIAAFAVKEGIRAWKGDSCAAPPGVLLDDRAEVEESHERT